MTHFIRTNHVLKNTDTDKTQTWDSINKAKKKSREIQKQGHTVSKSHKRTHRLHMTTAKR